MYGHNKGSNRRCLAGRPGPEGRRQDGLGEQVTQGGGRSHREYDLRKAHRPGEHRQLGCTWVSRGQPKREGAFASHAALLLACQSQPCLLEPTLCVPHRCCAFTATTWWTLDDNRSTSHEAKAVLIYGV